MSRSTRYSPGGMVFHVLNRGVGRRALFEKDEDYARVPACGCERVLDETLLAPPMRICASCLMPNHWHFLLWLERDGELVAFLQGLINTHVKRWKAHRREVGFGHLDQGRYKCFPVQTEDYFYHVARYVERNALRANLCTEAQNWRWCSAWRREQREGKLREQLSQWPVPFPKEWRTWVNQPQTEAELEAIRRCVRRGAPYGDADWTEETVTRLGLEFTLRKPGRPKKSPP